MNTAEQRQNPMPPPSAVRRDLAETLVMLRETLTELWREVDAERRNTPHDPGRTITVPL